MIDGSKRGYFSSAEMGEVRDAAGVPHPPPAEQPAFDGSKRVKVSRADMEKLLRMAGEGNDDTDTESAS